MVRGLPFSLTFHVLGLLLVVWLGNAVNRPEYEPPSTLNVHVVQLPKPSVPQIPDDPAPEKPVEVKPPQQDINEALPPKELPKEQDPVIEEPEVKKPETTPEPVEKPLETPPEIVNDAVETSNDPPVPMVEGASVSNTDANFPFAWYLSLMEGKIARNWNPRQMGFRNDSGVYCTVHFTIQKNGTVTGLTLVQSSGIGVYDREALRAVQAARLTPLPPDFGSSSLGVTMNFNLKTGD